MEKIYAGKTRLFYRILFLVAFVGCADPEFDTQVSSNIQLVSLNDAWIIDPYRDLSDYKFTLTNKNIFQIPATETSLHSDADFVKYHVSIQGFEYTTQYKGQDIKASGLLLLPIDTGNVHALLSYQHGPIFAERHVPSNVKDSLEMLASIHILPALILAANGYITLVPDLIGHGASSSHLYPDHLYQPSADAVVDMLLEGRKFLRNNGVPFHENALFLAGYSEGGYVTMAAQKAIEEHPEWGLSVTASAPGGANFNLNLGVPEIIRSETLTFPNVFSRRIAAWNEYYWQRPLTDFFQEPYASRISSMFEGELDFDETNALLTTQTFDLVSGEFVARLDKGEEKELVEALYTNSVNYWRPEAPTRIYKGTLDQYDLSQEEYDIFINDYKVDPKTVELVPLEGKNHHSALYPYLEATIRWFNTFESGL